MISVCGWIVVTFVLFFLLICQPSTIFSIATEPDLHEWTARTKVCDMLHDPVGIKQPCCELRDLLILLTNYALNYILQVRIAMVGKYTGLSDSYLSVLKVYDFKVSTFFLRKTI